MKAVATRTAATVAITGAGGHLGSCVAQRFADRGWRVLRLMRAVRGVPDHVEFRLGAPLPADALRGADALVHCAYDFSVVAKEDVERVNVGGGRELFAAAARAGVRRLACVSSISAYDGCVSHYGRTKLAVEAVARESGALVVRPGLMFGDPPAAMYGRLVEQVARLRIVPLIGDGSQIQYLVHRDDVAETLVRSIAGELPSADGRPVTVAHPRPWPMRDLLRTIARRMGRRIVLVPTPWRAVWAVLRTAELTGVQLKFHSDSVVSLMHQNPSPDFSLAKSMGIACRPFA